MRSTFGETPQQIKESKNALKSTNVSPLVKGHVDVPPQKRKQKKEKGAKKDAKLHTPFVPNAEQPRTSEPSAVRLMEAVHGLKKGHDTEAYYRAVAKPWLGRGVKSSIVYNPAPSFVSATATSTGTWENMTVAPNSTVQLCFFPGHARYTQSPAGVGGANIPATSSMDPTAYHCNFQLINTTRYSMGAVQSESVEGSGTYLDSAFGVKTDGLGLGEFHDRTDISSASPLLPDILLPYYSAGQQHLGEHLRNMLVSMGVRVVNTTKGADRGGNVVSVQPDMTMLPPIGSQSKMKIYRSWKNHGVCEREVEIAWQPRFEDQAFWHNAPVGHANALIVSTDAYSNATGIFVWLNNSTNVTQTYSINAIYNYEMAGANVASVSTARPVGGDKAFNETALSLVRQISHSASVLPAVAAKASAAIATGRSMIQAFGFNA